MLVTFYVPDRDRPGTGSDGSRAGQAFPVPCSDCVGEMARKRKLSSSHGARDLVSHASHSTTVTYGFALLRSYP